MKNLKVYNKIFSLILVGTIFCGSLTGCGVKAKEVENQDNAESKETTASENTNILEVETILMKDGSYVTFPGKISGDRKSIFTEIVLPNEQAILSTGHNLINVEKKADGVTAEDFIKALYNDEELNQLKDSKSVTLEKTLHIDAKTNPNAKLEKEKYTISLIDFIG